MSRPKLLDLFCQYWLWHHGPTGSPEAAVVERLALHQIWPLLTQAERDALTALAIHGSVAQAATATGMSQSLLHKYLISGRLRFQQHWYEGETVPPRKGRDRRRVDGGAASDGYRAARRAILRRATRQGQIA